MRRVLVLRPEPGNAATVARCTERGLEASGVPLFTIEPIAWTVPNPASFDALLLTSANAVRAAGEQLTELRGLPAYTVGETTAAAAREAGFDIAATGDSGVDRLLGSIPGELKLLHLRGEDSVAVAAPRQAITPCIVYRAAAVAGPAIGEVADMVALLHSPRAATRFAELVEDKGAVRIAALSPGIADAAGIDWAHVEAAHAPNEDALLALAARLCDNSAGDTTTR